MGTDKLIVAAVTVIALAALYVLGDGSVRLIDTITGGLIGFMGRDMLEHMANTGGGNGGR